MTKKRKHEEVIPLVKHLVTSGRILINLKQGERLIYGAERERDHWNVWLDVVDLNGVTGLQHDADSPGRRVAMVRISDSSTEPTILYGERPVPLQCIHGLSSA